MQNGTGRQGAGRVRVVRLRVDDRWSTVVACGPDGVPLVVVESRRRYQPAAEAMVCAMVGHTRPVVDLPTPPVGIHTIPPLPQGLAVQAVDGRGLALRAAAVAAYAAALREGVAVLFGAAGPLLLAAPAA